MFTWNLKGVGTLALAKMRTGWAGPWYAGSRNPSGRCGLADVAAMIDSDLCDIPIQLGMGKCHLVGRIPLEDLGHDVSGVWGSGWCGGCIGFDLL